MVRSSAPFFKVHILWPTLTSIQLDLIYMYRITSSYLPLLYLFIFNNSTKESL